MALIKFIHSEMALEHQILSLLNLLIGDKFESEFNQNRLRNTFYFVNHPVMQLQLSRRTYDIRCDSCLGRCARDGARDSLPPKPVDTYKVPTRVTFSDTDSTSSDESVNRCRYLSYF
jgi:hypothetical protein